MSSWISTSSLRSRQLQLLAGNEPLTWRDCEWSGLDHRSHGIGVIAALLPELDVFGESTGLIRYSIEASTWSVLSPVWRFGRDAK